MTQPNRKRDLQSRRKLATFCKKSLSLLMGLALAACSQFGSLGRIATLPPTFAIPTQAAPTGSPSSILVTLTPVPTGTDTPAPATLTTEEAAQTLKAATLEAYVETQLETLGQPTLTPTLCPPRGCTTPTTTFTPYHSPTPTQTATSVFPPAYIQITWPGPLSKVVSPIHLMFNTHTGPGGTLQVDLLGEDGRTLYRQVYRGAAGDLTYYNVDLPVDFEIPGVAEAARLQVSVVDSVSRLVAQSSISLVLLGMGDEEVNPPDDGMASIVIREPYFNQVISGGVLHVTGLVRPMNNSALTADLITDEGKLVGARQFTTLPEPLGVYRPFSVDIPYTVTQERGVRLTIRQEGDAIPGVLIAESVTAWLEP